MVKKILMVVAQQNFRDEEYEVPKGIFEKAGFEVLTAAEKKGVAKGKLGAEAKVDLSFNEINIRDYEAIVFVGGPGATVYFEHEQILNLVKEAEEEGKVISAICIAPSILANAGILKGKKATAFVTEEDILRRNGAIFTAAPIEIDGKIITGSGPESAEAFGQAILQVLGNEI